MTSTSVMVCLMLLGISVTANAAKYYKWVDDNGKVRYSDHIPISQVGKRRHVLNDQGVIIDTKESAKTVEELTEIRKAESILQAERELAKKNKEAQARRDRTLLLTYSSEDEITRVKDTRIEVVESVIRILNTDLTTLHDKLHRLETSAEEQYVSKDEKVPGRLLQNIEETARRIHNSQKQLAIKQAEKVSIETQYDIDLARFQVLQKK